MKAKCKIFIRLIQPHVCDVLTCIFLESKVPFIIKVQGGRGSSCIIIASLVRAECWRMVTVLAGCRFLNTF